MTDVLLRGVSAAPSLTTRDTADAEFLPCQDGEVADLFFSERPSDLEDAKQLCADCPLRTECLEGALRRGEPWGVWGGQILDGGRVIAVKRGRGRPRKNAA
jgi:WhiB family redox-sensing transcriptional regulator